MARRLRRNRRDAVFGGVAAGLGDYFDVDPVLVRLGFVFLTIASGVGLLFYIICWVMMPTDDEQRVPGQKTPAEKVVEDVRAAGERVVTDVREAGESGRGHRVGGAILVAVGLIFLVDRFSWIGFWPYWLRFQNLWPLILVAIGVALLVRSREEKV